MLMLYLGHTFFQKVLRTRWRSAFDIPFPQYPQATIDVPFVFSMHGHGQTA
jgi:hypothetical protein